MHLRATDRRSASKCQGKWPDQTLDPAFRGVDSGQHLASVLQEGRENANIDAGLGFVWRISAKECEVVHISDELRYATMIPARPVVARQSLLRRKNLVGPICHTSKHSRTTYLCRMRMPIMNRMQSASVGSTNSFEIWKSSCGGALAVRRI